MKLKKTIILPLVMLALLLLMPINVNGENIVGATLIPAPVGYSYVLDHPIGDVVGVYNANNTYKMYYARTATTSKFFYLTEVNSLLTKEGKYTLKINELNETYQAIALDLPGKNDLVLLSKNGYVYTSPYRVLFGFYSENGMNPEDGDVVITNKIDLTLNKKVTYIVPVTGSNEVVTIITKNYTKTESVAGLIGIEDSCIAFISNPPPTFPWYGGLIPSPLCTNGINKIVENTYNGQPLYTVFSKNINSFLVYFAFSDITPNLLVNLGFFVPVQTNPSVHIIQTTLDNTYVYYSAYQYTQPVMVNKISAIDSTLDTSSGKVCILSSDSQILFYLGWDLPQTNTSQITLQPGEVILYRSRTTNSTYLCKGDLSFMNIVTPSLTLPAISQFHEPIGVQSSSPTMIMLGNGKYYYGSNFTIPYSIYDGNSIWVLSNYPQTIEITSRSLWTTPFFWLSILLGALFAALLLQKPKAYPRKLQIIWDITTPPPLEFPDQSTIAKRVSQYIDIFGVCPNDVELAEKGILLPIKDEKPTDEVIVCNFKTNIDSEKVLRNVVKVANGGFWAFRRRGKNYGFLYTTIGDTLILFYLYKQEDETSVHELILNAIYSAKHTYIGVPLHAKYHGLIIVATPRMAKMARDELVNSNVIDERGRVNNIEGCFSVEFQGMKEKDKNALIEFAKERIPLILVVGEDITPLITTLGEIASLYYEEYLKRRGISDEEEGEQ